MTRLHPSLSVYSTVTGRIVSSSPELQDFPAPGVRPRPVSQEEQDFLNLDFSSLERRVFANLVRGVEQQQQMLRLQLDSLGLAVLPRKTRLALELELLYGAAH